MQWYDGLIGQVPWLHYFLRLNPLRPYIPGFKAQDMIITRMALEEIEKRNDDGSGAGINQNDLLSQLLKAHAGTPGKFSRDDVFSVAHGA
ncbi:Cytochrome P450, partial [Lasallia pustulata]